MPVQLAFLTLSMSSLQPAQTLGVVALAGQDRYEYVRDLSAGAHGFVQLARDTAKGEVVSIKLKAQAACLPGLADDLLHERS